MLWEDDVPEAVEWIQQEFDALWHSPYAVELADFIVRDVDRLKPPDRAWIKGIFPRFLEQANPFIRHIVLRTRDYLENTVDPETGEPYLEPVRVRLHGKADEEAIKLPPFLERELRKRSI